MSNTFTNLIYHIVYSTRLRRQTIRMEWRQDLYAYIGGLIKQRDGIALSIGGVADHIHILAKLSPKVAIMDVLRDIKAFSSKWINECRLTRRRFDWQRGYAAFSVGHSQVDITRNYINNQDQHHRTLSFETEFIGLLERNGIKYNPKYVFDDEHFA